jgi:hypothetical protein
MELPPVLRDLEPGELERRIREAVLEEARQAFVQHQARWIYQRLEETPDA